MENPFRIDVHGADFSWKGVVRSPLSASFTVRFNALSVGSLELAPTDPMREFLDAPGARIRVEYRDELLLSGPVRARRGTFAPGPATYEVEDDWILMRTPAWVMPSPGTYSSGQLAPTSLTDDAQTYNTVAGTAGVAEGDGYYHIVASTAEGVVKELVRKNLTDRLGLPVTVPASDSLGGNARTAGLLPKVRFGPLEDVTAELLAWSGLGFRIRHETRSAAGLTADVWEPVVWPQILTPESGIVLSGEWSITYPTATRVVLGGPGEDVARAFWAHNDSTGLEAEYGLVLETFRDATGASLNWGTTPDDTRAPKYYLLRPEVAAEDKTQFQSELEQAGRKALADGAPTAGVSAELSETDSFHFGGADGIHLGDTVTLLAEGVPFTDRITECELTLDESSGLVVKPQVGNRADDPDRVFADAIQRLATAQRRMSTGR